MRRNNFCSVILSLDHIVSTPQSANEIITTVNSGPLIGRINFHTFTRIGNIVLCWERDSSPVFLSCIHIKVNGYTFSCSHFLSPLPLWVNS